MALHCKAPRLWGQIHLGLQAEALSLKALFLISLKTFWSDAFHGSSLWLLPVPLGLLQGWPPCFGAVRTSREFPSGKASARRLPVSNWSAHIYILVLHGIMRLSQYEGVFHSEKQSGEIQSCKRPKKPTVSHATTFNVHESHVGVVWRNCGIPSVGQFGYALSVLHRTHSSIESLDLRWKAWHSLLGVIHVPFQTVKFFGFHSVWLCPNEMENSTSTYLWIITRNLNTTHLGRACQEDWK